jgi:hypothetical protein
MIEIVYLRKNRKGEVVSMRQGHWESWQQMMGEVQRAVDGEIKKTSSAVRKSTVKKRSSKKRS